MELIKNQIKDLYDKAENKIAFINDLRAFEHTLSELNNNPVDCVLWVDENKVEANEYNPNSVASKEMELLHLSIKNDGYTQPIVTIYDKERDKYVIVDGFHRYSVLKYYKDINENCKGMLPIVVIKKDINDRMASTIRHNRARGKHAIQGMANIVFSMLDNGWSDANIYKELGLEEDELIRLKHITGFSKLFESVEYKKAWETKKQILLKKQWEEKSDGDKGFISDGK